MFLSDFLGRKWVGRDMVTGSFCMVGLIKGLENPNKDSFVNLQGCWDKPRSRLGGCLEGKAGPALSCRAKEAPTCPAPSCVLGVGTVALQELEAR